MDKADETRTGAAAAPAATGRRERPALLVAAHGERGGVAEDRLVRLLVARLRERGEYEEVAAGFIRSAPALEAVAERLKSPRLIVYPLFMSDGYYVRQAIPERLGLAADGRDRRGRAVRIAVPLGLDPALPGLIAEVAGRAAARAGIARRRAHLLIAAHGSTKSTESADAARRVAGRVEETGAFASVTTAFLEEPPFLDAALKAVPGPAILFGLFAGEGMHAAEDLPVALARAGRDDVHLAAPLGQEPGLIAHIVAGLAAESA